MISYLGHVNTVTIVTGSVNGSNNYPCGGLIKWDAQTHKLGCIEPQHTQHTLMYLKKKKKVKQHTTNQQLHTAKINAHMDGWMSKIKDHTATKWPTPEGRPRQRGRGRKTDCITYGAHRGQATPGPVQDHTAPTPAWRNGGGGMAV